MEHIVKGKGVPPDKIPAITSTRNAAHEMINEAVMRYAIASLNRIKPYAFNLPGGNPHAHQRTNGSTRIYHYLQKLRQSGLRE